MADEETETPKEVGPNRHLHNVLSYLLHGGSEEQKVAAEAGLAHVGEIADHEDGTEHTHGEDVEHSA